MNPTSSQARKAGRGAAHLPSSAAAQVQARTGDAKAVPHPAAKPGGKPAPEQKGQASFASSQTTASSHPAPSPGLRQRGRTAPPTEGRPGPAAQFLDRVAQLPPSLNPILGIRMDDATQTAVIALDASLHIEQRLASADGALTPALMDELGAFARKMTLDGPDITASLVYSTLLDNADVSRLEPDLVKPVFRSMMQGPPLLPADRLAFAVKAVCALFPGCVLPQAWRGALLQAARESLAANGDAQAIADVTTAILYAAITVVVQEDARADMDQGNLQLALQDCVADPERPIGLVAWLNGAATHSQPLPVARRVLDALREMPDMAPHPLASVMVTLGAGTVMPLATDGTAPGEPLRRVLPWALALPESHREAALQGIAKGMGEGSRTTRATPAHLQTVLGVISELEEPIRAAGAQAWVGRMLGQVIEALADEDTAGGTRKGADAKAASKASAKAGGAARRETPGAADTKAGPGQGPGRGQGLGEAWPAQVLSALRAVLVEGQAHDLLLEHRLQLLGHGLARLAGGRDIPVATVRDLAAGLADSPIPARSAAQVLSGLVHGAGGPDLKEGVFGAFVQALAKAGTVRGAALACHLCAAVGAAGPAGRKLVVPAAQRMEQALGGPLPPPLVLGARLANAPVAAIRQATLARPQQLVLLEAALDMPGGWGEAGLGEQALECALLAAEDLDFAFEVAQRLCEQLDTLPGESLMRQLRSGLLTQVLASASSPDGSAAAGARLDRLAQLYHTASRNLWVAHAEAEFEREADDTRRDHKGAPHPGSIRLAGPGAFLASEAALMRGGLHAGLLEPLAADLEKLGAAMDMILLTSTGSASR